jgi:hypothetical protein
MPRYLASAHAVARLHERFPALSIAAGQGLAAAQWLARLAARADVVAQQAGMDLLLRLDLPTTAGLARLYLPVRPHPRDTWIICTVLTEAQALANLAQRADQARVAWRARKGFARPYARRLHHRHATLEKVA